MSRKKVIVRRFSSGLLQGYLPSSGFVEEDALILLDLSGHVSPIPLSEIKMVSFVREFNLTDTIQPERLLRKTFLSRPRTEGLWVRLTLQDEEVLEGLAPLDLSLLEGISEDHGLQFAPPDIRGNIQRLYVPRPAIRSLQILAVVTTPSRHKKIEAPKDEEQKDLFSNLPNTRVQ